MAELDSASAGATINLTSAHFGDSPATTSSGLKPAERSVSFNRDVHVKRIGRGAPRVTAALVGDSDGRLMPASVHKESISSRSKEDLAQEAALVLQQVENLNCVARDNRKLPGKFNTLPVRRGLKKRSELSDNDRRGSVTSDIIGSSPTTKRKKKLDRSVSDASQKYKSQLAKLFSPKLERKRNATIKRSVSDVGSGEKLRRKRSVSENEEPSSPTLSSRIKKQLSPIIEASPQLDKPFDFTPRIEKSREHIVPIVTEEAEGQDVVDEAKDMQHSSRYDSRDTGTTIRKMIHRLSNDRSPPPRLTSTMVTPGPGFGHNNNRPFSYTRPNDDLTQPTVQTSITINEKKHSQRSHSDSDEGLGLDRKDSSRENSPAEKDYRTGYNTFYPSESRRKPDRYTSKVFVQEETNRNVGGITSKTSELSARRDMLESRMKSRLLNDDLFSTKTNGNILRKTEHEIIDKPIVPSPVTPNRVSSPKRYSETYISETRTNSNGEKYIFEKELHDDNGKVYGFEKKITNKIPPNVSYIEPKKNGYKVETRTDKHGDKYIIETKTHDDYEGEFKPFMSDKSRTSPEERFETLGNKVSYVKSPVTVNRFTENRELSKSEDFLDREPRNVSRRRDFYLPKTRKNFETARGISKSSQRLDEVVEKNLTRSHEYITRSHENLRLDDDYVNTRDFNRKHSNYRNDLRDGRNNDDYDTDISQMTSHLETNGYYDKENRRTSQMRKRYNGYDGPPSSRTRNDRDSERDYNSSRYDSDATGGRESVHRREVRYRTEETSRSVRKEHRKVPEERGVPLRGSRNRLNYLDDSESARESPRGGKTRIIQTRLETFDESPEMTPRVFHESKIRRERHESRHRETGLTDPDRKDRLADSGIENDYRRDSQEADRREQLESEDEGFVTLQFIKHERKHTDRNMNLTPLEKRRYDKYTSSKVITTKPPSGVGDKKYEKKAAKKSGTMSKVRQLFGKKEKKAKEEKVKKKRRSGDHDGSSSGGTGALTDDEVTMRYREYRGDRLRSAKSARDLDYDIEQEYRDRRRLSTPSESPSPGRPARLSRSTGTLTHDDAYLDTSNTLTRENQSQPESKGWFKSLSRKNKTSTKSVDKKPRIPESEIMTTGTEDEEVSAPERISANKNIRFCGDTDQESLSSHRDLHRNKRADDQHVTSRQKTTINSVRQGIVNGTRKPSRHAESALSSGESTTGDSSQQSQNSQRSQRSVVYLHAATVGEIPGPNERRRAASREELNRPLQSHTRTVSRSVSVLAPWKPRHYREPFEINYDQQYQKPTTMLRRRQRSRDEATLGRRAKEPSRRSKDNLSKTGTISRSTLKSKDKQKVDRTVSTESLQAGRQQKNCTSRAELNRSTSVPRDPNKSAGWFKIKSKKSRA